MLSLLQLAFFAVPEEEEDMLIDLNLPDFLWQEKCERLLGLSKEYWNLPWTEDVTSVPERYFSLKENHREPFNPPAEEDGQYESLKWRMWFSFDVLLLQDIRDFFAQRRSKQDKRVQANELFWASLSSGREDLVDEMVHQMYIWDCIAILPKTISQTIKPIPFSASFCVKDYIIENHSVDQIFTLEQLLETIKGGNLRIVLYIEKYCGVYHHHREEFTESFFYSYVTGSGMGLYNPQGFYSILQYMASNQRKDVTRSLYKLETANKDHLLFVLSALADPGSPFKPGSRLNVSQEKVLRRNVIRDLNLAKAFVSHLTLDMLTLMLKSNKLEIRVFAQRKLDKGEFCRGPIIYGGDVSNKNLSSLPPGLRL
ncbi:Hypothetical protein BRZCDTV_224 [Brazilian cedratvirus IHUMI]|uniref:Uncharacterized protein n=1 Tax=Brazilian cedratvirus IHUMI TaxID=2126980 RepID=A0A2R8FE80_9VIRU|nr:Hypothetical protein BRZCDTV_224 [Brazilian cedratvirus IHUMI]